MEKESSVCFPYVQHEYKLCGMLNGCLVAKNTLRVQRSNFITDGSDLEALAVTIRILCGIGAVLIALHHFMLNSVIDESADYLYFSNEGSETQSTLIACPTDIKGRSRTGIFIALTQRACF